MLGELPNAQETRQAIRIVHHVQGLKRPGVVTELSLTSWEVLTFAIVVSLISGVVRGFTGFGGPAIMVLALTQFWTPASVPALALLVDYATNLQLALGAMRHTVGAAPGR